MEERGERRRDGGEGREEEGSGKWRGVRKQAINQ
jgi:hypothetical protein